jgi:hypothetical protein
MKTTMTQKVDELYDQLDNLEAMCGLFYDFKKFTIYKSIATTLRLLLTGSSGDGGLISHVLPAAQFLPLVKLPDAVMAPGLMLLPARVQIVSGQANVVLGDGRVMVKELNVTGSAVASMQWEDLFDTAGSPLPLADWLAQKFLRPERTLQQFISTIGNKDGGAHFDPNENIVAMQKWGNLQCHLIAGIAKSVRPQILVQLSAAFPNHTRVVR